MARYDGDAGNNSFLGTNGADVFYLRAGDDYAQGYGGADVMHGGAGSDTLYGQGGADTLQGDDGIDHLIGGAGADLLVGGGGGDSLWGEGGADTFRFNNIEGATNAIVDFSRAQSDVIDLRGIDANWNRAGDQGFDFLATRAFTGHAGEVRFEFNSALDRVIVQMDVNGDAQSDMSIILGGERYLYNSDFLL